MGRSPGSPPGSVADVLAHVATISCERCRLVAQISRCRNGVLCRGAAQGGDHGNSYQPRQRFGAEFHPFQPVGLMCRQETVEGSIRRALVWGRECEWAKRPTQDRTRFR